MRALTAIIQELSIIPALKYSEIKLDLIKKKCKDKNENYLEYMKCLYGSSYADLVTCENNAKRQYLRDYSRMINIYEGFLKHGEIFALDSVNKYICALYESTDSDIRLLVDYNPLNVDALEVLTSPNIFNKYIDKGKYILSKNFDNLEKELQELINKKQ